ncbi:hypothetical protein A4X13_0g3847 [Tilletia indica]|uniref:Uncharacterized protein n=1 Tax=Tilletia indica TaxID=43049 RepID=A0A177THC8_9BASI|nr:hypothetical protein A4X13_0g3847 [Tilletia indica]
MDHHRRNSLPATQSSSENKVIGWFSRFTSRPSQPSQQHFPSASTPAHSPPLPLPSGSTTPNLPSHIQPLSRQHSVSSSPRPPPPPQPQPPQPPLQEDDFYDAHSSLSAAPPLLPPPHIPIHHHNYQNNDSLSALGLPEDSSVLSFGSLGPPTELIVTGVVGPGQSALHKNFDVFHAIQNAQQGPNRHGAHHQSEGDAQQRHPLIKYQRALLNGDTGSASSLSIGAEGIDPISSHHHQHQYQYQHAPSPRAGGGAGGGGSGSQFSNYFHQPIQQYGYTNGNGNGHRWSAMPTTGATAISRRATTGGNTPGATTPGGQTLIHSMPVSPMMTPRMSPTASPPGGAGAGGEGGGGGASEEKRHAIINTWRSQVKAPVKIAAATTVPLVVPVSVTAQGEEDTAQQANNTSLEADITSGTAHSTVAPSTASLVTVHGGDLSSSAQKPSVPEYEEEMVDLPQMGAASPGGALSDGLRSRSGSRGSANTAGTGPGGGAGTGARTPTMRHMEPILRSGSSFASPIPPPVPAKEQATSTQPNSRTNSISTAKGGNHGNGYQNSQQQQKNQPEKFRRPPLLPMSADGAPPKFGSISAATNLSNFSGITSVSRR